MLKECKITPGWGHRRGFLAERNASWRPWFSQAKCTNTPVPENVEQCFSEACLIWVQHKMHVKWMLVKKLERWGYIVQELAFQFKEFVPEMIRCTILHWEFDPWVWQFFNSTQLKEMKQKAKIKCVKICMQKIQLYL